MVKGGRGLKGHLLRLAVDSVLFVFPVGWTCLGASQELYTHLQTFNQRDTPFNKGGADHDTCLEASFVIMHVL